MQSEASIGLNNAANHDGRQWYACGWYDKTRDEGTRFWAARPRNTNPPPAYLHLYLQGACDRPNSGFRGVDRRARERYSAIRIIVGSGAHGGCDDRADLRQE